MMMTMITSAGQLQWKKLALYLFVLIPEVQDHAGRLQQSAGFDWQQGLCDLVWQKSAQSYSKRFHLLDEIKGDHKMTQR